MNWESTSTYSFSITIRGYTGHEHMNAFNLINMNGRAYDPYTSQFLSPDPFIQDPANPQNYNRYSYVLNNPLKFTDPSGYLQSYYDPSSGSFVQSGNGNNADGGWAGWFNWFGGLNQFRDGFYTTGGSVLGIGSANEGLFSGSFYASDYGLAWYKQNTGHDLERHNGQWGYWSTKTVHEGYANVRHLAGGSSYNVNVFNSVNGGGDPPAGRVGLQRSSFSLMNNGASYSSKKSPNMVGGAGGSWNSKNRYPDIGFCGQCHNPRSYLYYHPDLVQARQDAFYYSLGVNIGVGIGTAGLGTFTTSSGFLFGSIGFRTPMTIRVGLYASENTLKYGVFKWSTIAPKALGQTNFFGRNMLQITPKFQPALGTWSSQVIPKGTYIRFGIIGPQNGVGTGTWFQLYAPQGVKFIP
jgi:RHS repeat-associated protein